MKHRGTEGTESLVRLSLCSLCLCVSIIPIFVSVHDSMCSILHLHFTARPSLDAWNATGALLQLSLRVDRFEFRANIVDLHLPFDAAMSGVYVFMPSSGLLAKFVFTANLTATHPLTCETIQLVFGNLQPAAVFGSVVEFKAPDDGACTRWFEDFAKRLPSCALRLSQTTMTFLQSA